MSKKIETQAVVLIHGIGEQRPILTLRGFVEPIADYLKKIRKQAREDESIFWDKPDPVSGNYETRKMVMREGRDHPSTHFYEFYWAHHMRDTRLSHIKAWLKQVVFRLPQRVSPRLIPVFFFVWFLLLAILSSVTLLIFQKGIGAASAMMASITTGLAGTLILGLLSNLLFNYLGDVPRYLDPATVNISERQAIRAEGISLLKGLHESKHYDRIIVVGHSLGTTIAYDLVKLLWSEYYYRNEKAKFDELSKEELEQHYQHLNAYVEKSNTLKSDAASLEAFRTGQQQAFEYLKKTGNPWLISDLVTIGSPLAHAGHLFAQEKGLFEKLVTQREYPVCPPLIQQPDKSWILDSKKIQFSEELPLKYFSHSSPFAVTRWTNIYYLSDYIGGPVQPHFGAGVKDIAIKRSNPFFFYPGGHTRYWDFDNKTNILPHLWDVLES